MRAAARCGMNAAHTVTRRQFSAATAALAGGFGVAACSSSGDSYHAAVQRIWRISRPRVWWKWLGRF